MTRKSPIKHDVKQHLREGHVVHHYERGKGKAPRQVIGSTSRGGGYSVTLIGSGFSGDGQRSGGELPRRSVSGATEKHRSPSSDQTQEEVKKAW